MSCKWIRGPSSRRPRPDQLDERVDSSEKPSRDDIGADGEEIVGGVLDAGLSEHGGGT